MKRREPLSIDLTPLVDVVFILLIFFIVSSTFKHKDYSLNLTLPSAVAKETKIQRKQINIEVTKNDIAFMGEKVSFDGLQNKLENLKSQTLPIVVKIDQDVKYDKVVRILDILQFNDLNNIALLTNKQ
jgi:biopolymer transport protein ExbD